MKRQRQLGVLLTLQNQDTLSGHHQKCAWWEQEMEQQQEARLEGMRACQREQLAIKTSKEREIKLC